MFSNSNNTEKCIKIYVEGGAQARFQCPDCGNVIKKNLSKFLLLDQVIKIKCRCQCGCRYTTLVERRKNFRKSVHFPGVFYQNGEKEEGLLLVKDVSLLGLGMKISSSYQLRENEVINVEFTLNDRVRSVIKRNVIIKNINKFNVNAEFCSDNEPDNYESFLLYK